MIGRASALGGTALLLSMGALVAQEALAQVWTTQDFKGGFVQVRGVRQALRTRRTPILRRPYSIRMARGIPTSCPTG